MTTAYSPCSIQGVLGPCYRLHWSDDACDWAVAPLWPEPAMAAEFAYGVYPGHDLSFDIVAPAARLDRLCVRLATYRRANTAHLWCVLRSSSGEILKRSYLDPRTVRDGDLHDMLDLRGLSFRPGGLYRVEISAPTGSEENALGIWAVRGRAGGYELVQSVERFRADPVFAYRDFDGEPLGEAASRPMDAVLVLSSGLAPRTRRLLSLISAAFPDQGFTAIETASPGALWPLLRDADAVVFAEPSAPDIDAPAGFEALHRALYRRGVCTLGIDVPDALADIRRAAPVASSRVNRTIRARRASWRLCRYLLDAETGAVAESDRPAGGGDWTPLTGATDLGRLVARARVERSPTVRIDAALSQGVEAAERFIQAVVAQTHPGLIELAVSARDPSVRTVVRDAALWLRARDVCGRIVGLADERAPSVGSGRDRDIVIRAHPALEPEVAARSDFVARQVFARARLSGVGVSERRDAVPALVGAAG